MSTPETKRIEEPPCTCGITGLGEIDASCPVHGFQSMQDVKVKTPSREVKFTIEDIAKLAAENAELQRKLGEAEGRKGWPARLDEQLQRISELPLNKGIHESLADAVARIVAQLSESQAALLVESTARQNVERELLALQSDSGVALAESQAARLAAEVMVERMRKAIEGLMVAWGSKHQIQIETALNRAHDALTLQPDSGLRERVVDALLIGLANTCSMQCPSLKQEGEDWKHHSDCKTLDQLIDELTGGLNK